jgi:hypothetical protein
MYVHGYGNFISINTDPTRWEESTTVHSDTTSDNEEHDTTNSDQEQQDSDNIEVESDSGEDYEEYLYYKNYESKKETDSTLNKEERQGNEQKNQHPLTSPWMKRKGQGPTLNRTQTKAHPSSQPGARGGERHQKELKTIGKSGKKQTSTKRKQRQLTDMDDVFFVINSSHQPTWTKEPC